MDLEDLNADEFFNPLHWPWAYYVVSPFPLQCLGEESAIEILRKPIEDQGIGVFLKMKENVEEPYQELGAQPMRNMGEKMDLKIEESRHSPAKIKQKTGSSYGNYIFSGSTRRSSC